MTAIEKQLLATKLRRREFQHETPDPIQDAIVVSRKVQSNGCFAAFVAPVLVIVAVAVAVLL